MPAAALCLALAPCGVGEADPVAPHPDNPRLIAINGRPEILRTFGEHYSSVVRADFEFVPYLDTLRLDGLNLTRAFLVGFRINPTEPDRDPLAVPPERFLQPWPRAGTGGTALDGLGKWDFGSWNEDYFDRLQSFVGACDERGVVVELAFFCTFYTELQYRSSPFHPSNNVQGLGPEGRYDCFRPGNDGLLEIQEAVVREIVRRLNGFDNIIYNIQNEPFWNEPNVRDDEEVEFHNLMLDAIRDEESGLPKQHLVGHNFPVRSPDLGDFDIINEHYPTAVPGTPVRGAEALLMERYGSGKILSLDETDPSTPDQTRLEAWMFILGGGAIYNGLDYVNRLYHVDDETGSEDPGPAMRETLRNLGTYVDSLNLVALRRDLSWIVSEIPEGATLQAIADPGQQYVAYLHHGLGGQENFQLAYDPIDDSNQTAALEVDLPAGTWRVSWTRPADLEEIQTETRVHEGGTLALTPAAYQMDVALRIDRADAEDTTPPPGPSSLRALPAADGSIVLEWSGVDAFDLADHRIYRREEGVEPPDPETPVASVPAGTSTWLDTSTIPGSTYSYFITAVDVNGNESIASNPFSSLSEIRNAPFHAASFAIPGVIEAEDFDVGGPEVAYVDASPGNNGLAYRPDDDVDIEANESGDESSGHHVTSIQPGEWLEFSVAVATHGVFRPTIRIRAPAPGGTWSIEFDGTGPSGVIEIPAPEEGAEVDWETLSGPEIPLTAGDHILRLTFQGTDPEDDTGDLDWIDFADVPKPPPVADAGIPVQVIDHDSDGTAEVVLDASASLPGEAAIETYQWTIGSTRLADGPTPTVSLPVGEHPVTLTVTDGYGLQSTAATTVQVIAGRFANGSFENGFDGWTYSGHVTIQEGTPYETTDAARLLAFNNHNLSPNGEISQHFATIPGATYELAFDFGVLAFNNNFQRLGVEVEGETNLLSESLTVHRLPGSNTHWISRSFFFLADSDTTKLIFRDQSETSHSLDLILDHIRVVQQISRTLTVASTPFDGAAVSVNPSDTGEVTPFSRTFPNETVVTLEAPPSLEGYGFEKWTLDGADLATTAAIQLTLDADAALTAHYVEGPPVILGGPDDAVVEENAQAAFSVTAEGTGTLLYQWRRDGIDIDGANDPELVIPAVTVADEGTYDVVVSNNAGDTTSGPATLSIQRADEFANGSFEDGFDGWSAEGNVSIQQGGLYTATDGSRLVAFNNGNSTPDGVLSREFATAPDETYELSFDYGVLAYNNNPQTIEVEVAGNSVLVSDTLTVQRLPGSNIRWLGASYLFTADHSLTTLTFRDRSTATNGLDLTLDHIRIIPQISRTLTVASSPFDGAAVSVNPSDTGEVTPFSRTFPNETVVTLEAPPSLEGYGFEKWTLDGADLATTAVIQLTLDADAALTAHYVEGPPVILGGPDDAVVEENAQAAFSVTAEGTGTLLYQWRRDGIDIDGANDPDLVIPAVTVADEGTYDVVVSNNAGDTTSGPATLSIQRADEFANGSFEDGFDGWSAEGNVSIQQGGLYTATDGSRLVAFNNGNSTPDGVLSREFATAPGEAYELSFDYGVLAYNNNPQTIEVEVAGNSVLVSDTLTVQRLPGSNIRWLGASYLFTADHSLTTLTFRDLSIATNGLDLTLDHIRIIPQISRTLTVASTPFDGAAISVNPSDTGEVTPFSRTFPNETVVTLEAPPSLEGYGFEKWTLDGADLATTAVIQLTLDADAALTAHYVEGPPVILGGPDDAVVEENAQAAFSVTAEGTGTLLYQWRRDGIDIDGANDPDLVIPAVTVADEGTYDVVVSNNAGDTTSGPATLSIQRADEFANGSFEDAFDGWSVQGNVSIQQTGLYVATDGSRLVAFNNGNSTPDGMLSREFATVPGELYELSFDYGVLAYNNNPQTIEVEVAGSGVLVSESFTTQRLPGSNIRWTSQSILFTADASVATLTFRDLSTATVALDLTLDNVRITPVAAEADEPAPRSLALRTVAPPAAKPPLPGMPKFRTTGSSTTVDWNAAEPGRYDLQRSENLRDWDTVDSFIAEKPGPIELTDPQLRGPRVFYRIARPD